MSNLKEVKARSGIVIALATTGDKEITEEADHVPSFRPRRMNSRRFWSIVRCNCSPITSPCEEDAM